MATLRGPDGGPFIPVKIQPTDFHDAATKFAAGSSRLNGARTALFNALAGNVGCAGVDESAHTLDSAYRPAVAQLVTGIYRAQNVLGDIGAGIDMSARNHWMADAAATPGGGAEPPWQSVEPGLLLPPDIEAPTLVGNPAFALAHPLSDKIPLGRTDRLQALADAFHGCRDSIESIATDLYNDLKFLFVDNQSADLDALNGFWDKVGGASDQAILTALRLACDKIASALSSYAGWTIDTQNQIADAVLNAVGDMALGAAVGVIIAVVSGVAEAAAATEVSATGAALGAAGGGVIGMLTAAINSTPNPDLSPSDLQFIGDAQEEVTAENLADKGGGEWVPGPQTRLADYFEDGRVPKASELEAYAREQGWRETTTETGPEKWIDNNDVVRITLKQGSPRTPGSESPHVEIRDAEGNRTDPLGNRVTRRSAGNHTPIEWDLG